MSNWLYLSLAVLLAADADIPRVNSLRPPANPTITFPANEEISPFPDLGGDASDNDAQVKTGNEGKSGALTEDEKLALIRFVSGEFAKAVKALPAGKEGFIVHVGKPLSTDFLDSAVATHGAAINSGDQVQITKLEFQSHQIVVDLNGGGRGKKRLRDRIHLEVGGMPTARTTTEQESGPPGLQPGMGSTVFLDFGKPLPELTGEDLKKLLAPLLDFSKQRSASVYWVDTLPPEMRKAITEKRAEVGMDREMVIAAKGKPDHKIRERDQEGNDIEDWIYGQPPSKTVFVRFLGDRVTSIKQFPK